MFLSDCRVGHKIRGPSGTVYEVIEVFELRVSVHSNYPHGPNFAATSYGAVTSLDEKALEHFTPAFTRRPEEQ